MSTAQPNHDHYHFQRSVAFDRQLMHKTLERQLKRLFKDSDDTPAGIEELLKVVSRTYDGHDEELRLMERSLEISSKELTVLNKQLLAEKEVVEKEVNEKIEELKEKVKELEQFQKLLVDRELKMIELKTKIKALQAGTTQDN